MRLAIFIVLLVPNSGLPIGIGLYLTSTISQTNIKSTFTTINGMLFVTLEMVLMVAKDKSWTCEFINPCRNFFFQYLNPIQYKDSLHVIISCAYHLSHFIEFIFKLRGVFSVNLIA